MTTVFDQLQVGDLIHKLESVPDKNQPLAFCLGIYPNDFFSYRGYYEDLAIGLTTHPVTVGEWLPKLKNQIGAVHQGWKGGKYTTTLLTALWAASDHGDTGSGVIGVKAHPEGWVQILLTHDD